MLNSTGKAKGLVVSSFLRLGDQIVCSPIYRILAERYPVVVIPSNQEYLFTIKNLLKDCTNIIVQGIPNQISHSGQLVMRKYLEVFGFDSLRIGRFADDYMTIPNVRTDEYFYIQAKLDFDNRWSRFYFDRDSERESWLEKELGISDEPFIFVHEDLSRGMKIKRNLIPNGIRVIEPNKAIAGAQVLDYLGIIERAMEIHCIESSFSALIESIDLQTPKFIHRYAREKVMKNSANEFTYRSSWTIYMD
jgi:hypothetical protein